jgi:hypothetical protein
MKVMKISLQMLMDLQVFSTADCEYGFCNPVRSSLPQYIYVYVYMYVCMYVCNVCMHPPIEGWMDGWMDERLASV